MTDQKPTIEELGQAMVELADAIGDMRQVQEAQGRAIEVLQERFLDLEHTVREHERNLRALSGTEQRIVVDDLPPLLRWDEEPQGLATDVVELDTTGRPRREAKGPSWFDQFVAGLRGQ